MRGRKSKGEGREEEEMKGENHYLSLSIYDFTRSDRL